MADINKRPICGKELLVGTMYDGNGVERGIVSHHCQVTADTRGKALDEYVRRCAEAFGAGEERACVPDVEHHGDLILTRYPCCGYELKEYRYSPYPEVALSYCPNCGAKVVW